MVASPAASVRRAGFSSIRWFGAIRDSAWTWTDIGIGGQRQRIAAFHAAHRGLTVCLSDIAGIGIEVAPPFRQRAAAGKPGGDRWQAGNVERAGEHAARWFIDIQIEIQGGRLGGIIHDQLCRTGLVEPVDVEIGCQTAITPAKLGRTVDTQRGGFRPQNGLGEMQFIDGQFLEIQPDRQFGNLRQGKGFRRRLRFRLAFRQPFQRDAAGFQRADAEFPPEQGAGRPLQAGAVDGQPVAAVGGNGDIEQGDVEPKSDIDPADSDGPARAAQQALNAVTDPARNPAAVLLLLLLLFLILRHGRPGRQGECPDDQGDGQHTHAKTQDALSRKIPPIILRGTGGKGRWPQRQSESVSSGMILNRSPTRP
jgi:hypothetical protein